MSLSFAENLQNALEEFQTGTQRFEEINHHLAKNLAWKKEAYEHLKNLLLHMVKIGASDINLGGPRTNDKVWYRVYGNLEPSQEVPTYTNDEVAAIALSILSDQQKTILFNERNIDFAFAFSTDQSQKPYRFRGDIYYERNNLAINFRHIAEKIFPIESLEIPEPIIKRLDLQHEKSGLFLVTGVTGSGKSTTLDSITDMNNHNNKAHIVIIGKPIEYVHKSDKSLITHREVGDDVLSFRNGIIEALRQDPNIIIVGEMRDPATISAVLEATDSGHKIFSTLHTSSTVESIHRIIAEFPSDEQERIRFRLADTLKVVISQKLVPNKEGKRTLAKEILSVDYSVQAAIRNNNITEIFQMITEGKNKGMFTLQQDLYRLVRNGTITTETALNYCNNKKIMQQLLGFS
ncbi:MAG TPA: PilT/PilU family type 4a pilus ATPase [Candidatus Marinimicrobia bacterium]|jgi:twitching motility protein PilT|nr:PilT/PilU family type 4a pilus ATPase [Candidatus Neomarinimicrobiota bacterium]